MTDPPAPSTEILVRAAQGGDSRAYDRLFSLAAERIRLYVRARLGARLRSEEDSLDLLQQTYLAAHQAFGSFEYRGDDAFVRWLCRIAENCIRDRVDHHGARKRRPPGRVPVSRALERLLDPATGPATTAQRREQREHLVAHLDGLDDESRDAVLQRFFQDRTIADIAESLGRSPSGVRRLLGRALLELGRGLRASPEADDAGSQSSGAAG